MEKEDFIKQIIPIVSQGIPGENRLTVSDEQIAELHKADDLQDAIFTATNFGWGDYIAIWSQQAEVEPGWNFNQILAQSLLGQQPIDYIGVDATQPIEYEGEATTIGNVGENFYIEGDQNVFVNLMPSEIRDIQADLVNAGLLGSKVGRPFRPGVWDANSDGAGMSLLMQQANISGLGKKENGWRNSLQLFIDNPVPLESNIQPYLPPDYKTVSNSINNLFERDLGRKPQAYELKLLAETYLNESLSEYQQDLEFSKPDQETVTPEMLANYGNHIQEPEIREETDIDPSAALLDTFDRITKTEQERLGRNADIQTSNNLMLNSIISAPR